jgi:hypothetical protein
VVDEEDAGTVDKEGDGNPSTATNVGAIDEESEGEGTTTDAQVGDQTQRTLRFLATCPPHPETQVLPPKLQTLLMVATACNSILASKETNRATQLIDAVQGHNTFVGQVSSLTAEDSLDNLALCCCTVDLNIATSDFFYMLCTIHLRVRVLQ